MRDDGSGIERDELALALSRHATSKIATLDDLERVGTLGFAAKRCRASPRSSRMRMTSRSAGRAHWHMQSHADDGELSAPEPAAHPVGTTIEVRDLFFNMPARRKFLRAERTETQHIARMVERLALARFDVAFSLTAARRSLALPGGAHARRARARASRRSSATSSWRNALYFEHETAGCTSARLAVPAGVFARAARHAALLSERPLGARQAGRDAVRLGYHDVLFQGRQPAFVLFLELDPRRST